MQNFLPYPDFAQSAATLSRPHLGKQRVENLQMMQALLEARLITKSSGIDIPRNEWVVDRSVKPGWAHHTATSMWRGYEWHLVLFQKAVCDEWTSRGYKDSCLQKTLALYFMAQRNHQDTDPPPWLGDPQLHIAYKSNLIRKDRAHYGPQFPDVPDDLPYVWPV